MIGFALLVFAVAVAVGASPAPQTPARVRPPAAVECARDHLTAYVGVVLGYRREADRTSIRIRTDWGTTEDVTIAHPGSDPGRWFLVEGQPFQPADTARIEGRPGKLRAGVRAAAWVCDDGRNPIVDWNPPRER